MYGRARKSETGLIRGIDKIINVNISFLRTLRDNIPLP
jgi:hypothetical protein